MNSYFRIRWARYQRPQFSGSHQPCRLCGGDTFMVVSRRDRWFNPLVNVMCRQCGLIFLDPMPTDAEVAEYYKHHYWLRSQGAAEPTTKTILRGERRAKDRLQLLAPVLKPGMRILDVGTGGAEFLVAARQRGFEVEGIEPNLGYARYCERTYGIKVHAASVAEVDFGTRKFDLITCNHALEHMREPLDSLQRLHRVLQPDGYLFVEVPDLAEPNRWPYRYFHIAHLYGFSHETLVMMAAKAGFAPADMNQAGTSLIFRRLAGPDPNWFRFPDHPAKAEVLLRERTILRYLTSIEVYRRIPVRIGIFLRDFFAVMLKSMQSRRTETGKSLPAGLVSWPVPLWLFQDFDILYLWAA